MASIGGVIKKVRKPQRLMGMASHDVEGPVLYFEYGQFTIANAATTGTLVTGLTNVIAAIFTPLNVYGITAAPYLATAVVDPTAGVTVNNTNPGNAAGGIFSYLLIGTVETV